MDTQTILRELPKGLLYWYPFKQNTKVLYIGQKEDSLLEVLKQKELQTDLMSEADFVCNTENQNIYDYILVPYVIEQCENPARMLKTCYAFLKEEGVLLLGMNNRLGLRYFCGDRDPYTGRNFDGIEDYKQVLPQEVKKLKGRQYSKAQMEVFMEEAGWAYKKFYSVLPHLEAPQLIYAEDYLPKENLGVRFFPRYHFPDTVFLDEKYRYEDLIKNGMFHQMANAYLIECVKRSENLAPICHITLSQEREKEDAMATLIYRDKVEKVTLHEEGQYKFEIMQTHEKALAERGISTVSSAIIEGVYTMPYMTAPIAMDYLRDLFYEDRDAFLQQLDSYRELVLKSSDHVDMADCEEIWGYTGDKNINLGIILKNGYIDLIPLNCFYIDGEFVFYDQEFCMKNLPANVILYRAITVIYSNWAEMNAVFPMTELWKRYGMEDNLETYTKLALKFTEDLRNIKEQRVYLENHEANYETIHSNRQRMNFSSLEYQKLFVDIFDGVENKRLFLFGSGNFAKKFVSIYGKDMEIVGILDNSKAKWGTEFEGIPVFSPEILKEYDTKEYKVIICIKKYLDVLKQLRDMGVRYLGIYDTNMVYPSRSRAEKCILKKSQEEKKPYHTGYIAGVFDLFHIGHLNMFRRAKEQCEYLIVGVVSDEGVRKYKKVEPYVPFEERIEMVRSCRYVDEAVEIPLNFGGTKDAYRMYHFDCQFSGSDYQNDPNWLAEKEFLDKQGVDMVFFPYTESTSSTKLKALIDKSLV